MWYIEKNSNTPQDTVPILLYAQALTVLSDQNVTSESLEESRLLFIEMASKSNLQVEVLGGSAQLHTVDKTLSVALIKPSSSILVKRSDMAPMYVYCGLNKKITFAHSPEGLAKKERQESPVDSKVLDWLKYGERGSSSECMCQVMYGVQLMEQDRLSEIYPHDGADLRRCVKFLEATESSDQIGKMTGVSEHWEKLVANWEPLVENLKKEMAGTFVAESTYKKMQKIFDSLKTTQIKIDPNDPRIEPTPSVSRPKV